MDLLQRWKRCEQAVSSTLVTDTAATSLRIDLPRAQAAVRELLIAVGEDPNREGLQDTPRRVAEMWTELLEGMNENPAEHLRRTFDIDHDEVVLVRDIPFSSMCEHHLLPFRGVAHIAYLPGTTGRFTGLSKLARLVDGYAKRLQVQEQLTSQIASALETELEPVGVFVMVESEHFCMAIRGVKKPGTMTVTTAARGLYRVDKSARAEVAALIRQ